MPDWHVFYVKRTNPSRGIRQHGRTYQLNVQVNGVRRWVNLETNDYAEAIARAERIRKFPQVISGGPLTSLSARYTRQKMALGEFTSKTSECVASILAILAKDVGDREPRLITRDEVSEWFISLRKRMREAGACTYARTARAFFNWCIEHRHSHSNPFAKMKIKSSQEFARRDFVPQHVRDELITNASDPEIRFVLYGGFYLGMRKGEIVEARRDWFDLDRGVCQVRHATGARVRPGERSWKSKGNQEREIPLHSSVIAFLSRWDQFRCLAPLDFVLRPSKRHGKSAYRWDFREPLNKYFASQVRAGIYPHLLRRSFGAALAVNMGNLLKTARWLGDSPEVANDHYTPMEGADPDIELLTRKSPRAAAPQKRSIAKKRSSKRRRR